MVFGRDSLCNFLDLSNGSSRSFRDAANPNLLQPSDLLAQLLKILIRGSGLTIPRRDQQPLQARAWTGWWVLGIDGHGGHFPLPGLFFRRHDLTLKTLVVKVISFLYLLLVLIRILKNNEIFPWCHELDYLRHLITINPPMQWPNFQLHISSEILIWRPRYYIFRRYNYNSTFLIPLLLLFIQLRNSVILLSVLVYKVFCLKDLAKRPESMSLPFFLYCVSLKSWNPEK